MDQPQCIACAIAGEVEGDLDQLTAGLHFALGLPTSHPSGGSPQARPRQVSAPGADEIGRTPVS
jgi:hypothetical protein